MAGARPVAHISTQASRLGMCAAEPRRPTVLPYLRRYKVAEEEVDGVLLLRVGVRVVVQPPAAHRGGVREALCLGGLYIYI